MTAVRVLSCFCLLTLGAATGGAGEPAADNLRFFPADTEIIVTVNLRQILESELVKGKKEAVDLLKAMLEGALQHNEEIQSYLKELSFDPFKDLDRVTTVSGPSADSAKVLVLINGHFDAKKLAAAAAKAEKDHGDVLKVTRVGKHQIIEITPPGKEETYFVVLADAKTLLVSQGKTPLTRALAQAAGDKEVALKKEVKDLLASQEKNACASFVATGTAVGKLLAASKDPKIAQAGPVLEKLLEKIDGFNGGITLATDVQFQLGVGTKDAESAKEFAQQAAFGLAILPLALAKEVQKNQQLAPLLDVVKTLRASAQGNTFILRGQVAPEVMEKALKGALNR